MSKTLFAMIAGTGEGNDYTDRFLEGEHIVALNNMGEEASQDHGPFISVDFIVLESTVPNYKGKACGEAYFIAKSDKDGGKGAKQRMYSLGKAAVQSLGGNPDDQTPAQLGNGQMATAGAVLVQNTLAELCDPSMPWRGLIVRATASKKTGKNSGKEYVAVKYSAIPQTVDQIHACRALIEQTAKLAPPVLAQPAATVAQPVASMLQAQPAATPVAPTPVASMLGLGGGSLLGNR